MVVNDDEAVREAICFVLRLEGLEVCAHADATSALACPELPAAHCLVLGDHPPVQDGCELLRLLRARNAAAPAILLAGRVTPVLRARAGVAGMAMVLEKPLLDNTLVEAVLAAVEDT
ncbi:response regulator [Acidocella sp.]|uniref:response regulator n=1 Tax=Acidocella sp. TaxID=50710 RepID=UPI002609CE47|nr:response regulator [Acidocella sp.]